MSPAAWGSHQRRCALLALCSLIREFEKEARADGQDANAVQRKKTVRLRLLLAPAAASGGCRWPTWGGGEVPRGALTKGVP